MNAASRPRGRPRNPDKLTPAATARRAKEALLAAGGAVRSIHLSAEALAALARIRARDGDRSDRAVIERVLIAAGRPRP